MRGSEGIVDVHVSQFGERPAKGSDLRWGCPLAFFFGVVPKILEQNDATRSQIGASTLNVGANAVREKTHLEPELLVQYSRDGLEGILGVGLAIWTPQVAHQDHRCALVERVLDGGQCCVDASGIGDLAVLHRHVEVDANERALAGKFQLSNGQLVQIHSKVSVIEKRLSRWTRPRGVCSETRTFG
jgi:hypothetical protein